MDFSKFLLLKVYFMLSLVVYFQIFCVCFSVFSFISDFNSESISSNFYLPSTRLCPGRQPPTLSLLLSDDFTSRCLHLVKNCLCFR